MDQSSMENAIGECGGIQSMDHICQNTSSLKVVLPKAYGIYTCGGCSESLETICLLHEHLQKENNFAFAAYLYDFVTKTAFPKHTARHVETQTEVGDIENAFLACTSNLAVTLCQETQTDDRSFETRNESLNSNTSIKMKRNTQKRKGDLSSERKPKKKKIRKLQAHVENMDVKIEDDLNSFDSLTDVREVKQEVMDFNYDESTDDNLDLDLNVNSVKQANSDENQENMCDTGSISSRDDESYDELMSNDEKSAGVKKKVRKKKSNVSDDEWTPDKLYDSKPVTDRKKSSKLKKKTNVNKAKHKTKKSDPNNETTVEAESDHHTSYLPKQTKGKNLRVSCDYCKLSYFSEKKLNRHLYSKHRDIFPFACHQCNWSLFKTEEELAKHKTEHKTEVYHCDLCGKDLTTKEGMKLHKQIHLGEKAFKCDQCSYSSHTRNSLRQHMYTHAASRSEQCDICGRGFYTKSKLREHLRYCRKEFKHYCPYCKKGFVARGAMDIHVLVHTGEHPFVCEICGFATTTAFLLKGHRRTHTGEKPYKCKECGAQLASRETLVRHLRTHSHEKPYVCSHCSRAFTSKWNLSTHLRQHTGETPYKCDICGQGFKQNVLRKTHMRTHTEPPVDMTKLSSGHHHRIKSDSDPTDFLDMQSFSRSGSYEQEYQNPQSLHTDNGINLSQDFHVLNFSKGHNLIKLAADS